MKALLLYFRLLAWMFGQVFSGLLALCLIPFAPKRSTVSASSFYDD